MEVFDLHTPAQAQQQRPVERRDLRFYDGAQLFDMLTELALAIRDVSDMVRYPMPSAERAYADAALARWRATVAVIEQELGERPVDLRGVTLQ